MEMSVEMEHADPMEISIRGFDAPINCNCRPTGFSDLMANNLDLTKACEC